MSILEELAYWEMLARRQQGHRTKQKKARRETVLAGPRIELGVQRMSRMDLTAGWGHSEAPKSSQSVAGSDQ